MYLMGLRFTSHIFGYLKSLNFYGNYWSILMLLMLVAHQNFFTNAFENSFLKLCGKFSFGIYLLHPMVISFFIQINLKASLKSQFELLASAVACSIILGYTFFKLIENPLMKLANYLCKLKWLNNFIHKTIILLLIMLLFLYLCLTE